MKKFPSWLLTVISIVIGIVIWYLLSAIPAVGAIITSPLRVVKTLLAEIESGRMLSNIWASLLRVIGGFSLGLIVAVPAAFLMAWYAFVRAIVDPWIQFFRTIPPIALIPLVIVSQGVGESAKISVIFVATFLVMVISIFQGVRNVDPTLIRAARVLGATDKHIFLEVIVPASFPYILVGVRLGLAAAWTTLVAAELTGANKGLGNMIMEASLYFRMDVVILGIMVIGIIGLSMDRFVLFLERRLTGWQELRQG
ncbi:ABC transporter permease [Paenibacillus planticolens]|uniref:ABC transporter permease subunit n=1 Tax=Paenibacillus planticolens TaxID=2654976 RepID=A0ABX1ZSQ5_9BACL|nr:ABC transporter permease [Paenibacillus planticolens]NOV02783.1 ABC transporter permease subunit [Paenibacillus planticolens]